MINSFMFKSDVSINHKYNKYVSYSKTVVICTQNEKKIDDRIKLWKALKTCNFKYYCKMLYKI